MRNNTAELIQRILEGDDAAFACLVRKYQKRVHALAWRKIGDFHIAEDITQETFLQVYRKLAKLKDPSQFPGWLYVIANRRCLAWLRKKRVQTQSLEEIDIAMTERSSYSRHVAASQAESAAETKRELVKNLLAKLDELSIQPRGSLSITLPTTSTLRFAYGRYEQSPFAYQILKTSGNRDLESSIAEHYVVELEHKLSPQTELKFALYYKDLRKLVNRSINVDALFDDSDTLLTTPYRNQGTGFVNGAELFLRHRVSEKFFGWLSYAYTHAERRETPDAPYRPFLFDNTHIVSLVANYSPTPKNDIGVKWQYVSGTSVVPLSTLLMIQDPVTLGMHPLLSDVTGAIAPAAFQAYHRLDLRLSRKRTQWGIPITEFIEVWNVYNSQNKINFSFPDKLVTEFKAADAEEFPEEFPINLETSEYRSPVRFPFNFTFGATYEF